MFSKYRRVAAYWLAAASSLAMVLYTTCAGASPTTATYYGDELRGHRTASGEVFNPDGLTAASRTLPFGACLLVSYRGRSTRVRVNDRGPFTRGVGLDLSRGAARAIGMPGRAQVEARRC